MGGSAQKATYLRFVLISLFAVAAVTAALAYLSANSAAGRERNAAAREATKLIAEPLLPMFDPIDKTQPAPATVSNTVGTLAFTLGGGALDGIRVAASDGTPMYVAGVTFIPPAREPDAGDTGSATARGDGGEKLFISRLGAEGYVIDVAQDAGPIDSAIGAARARAIVTALAFGAGAWLLMIGAFAIVAQPLMREHRRLAHLYVTGEQLRSSMDLHDVLTQLAQDATTLGGGQYGLVALFDEATSEVMLRATFDRQTGTVSLHQRAIDEWFVRRCIATNTAIVSTLSEGGGRQYFGADAALGRDAPLLCAPMAIRDRVVGAIAVVGVASGRGGFSPSDVRLIEQLCGQAVTAVEQSQLFARVRSDANEIEASYDSTLKALMAALDAKDETTEGHCERVAKITVQLARAMELPESMLVHIERGAMLHDVGKIGVPDEVLKKPAALTEGEWDTMRKHPMLAGLMVSKVGFLEPAMPILLYHHEKFDGSGYPFGLAGENIPIEARIFTIVDAYDAMTQDRPYRSATTHVDAMDEIRRHNGTQFDPAVVTAFEQLMASRPDLRGGATSGRRVLGMDDLAQIDHDDEHAA